MQEGVKSRRSAMLFYRKPHASLHSFQYLSLILFALSPIRHEYG